VAACLQYSYIWLQLWVLRLCYNMRLPPSSVNQEYAKYLAQLSYKPVLDGCIMLSSYIHTVSSLKVVYTAIFPLDKLQQH
jgi:hypothetical protein